MATMASTFAPTVTVKVYQNGNSNFLGKTLVINRRHIRTMDALYDQVTSHISAFNAVRKICTPIGGRPVQNLESIRNKSVYVAAGREEFKKLNYADLGVSKRRPPRKTNIFPKRTVTVAEGRHKMDYEWGKRDLKILYVFRNGDLFTRKVKIVLQKRLQQSMEQILNIVQDHVFMAAAIAALYTKDGKLVLSPAELVTGGDYVAVERGRLFKKMTYGGGTSSLSRSLRANILPQIGNGQLTNTGRLSKKDLAKRKPRITKANAENNSSEQSRGHSRVTNVVPVTSLRGVISNTSPDPPTAHGLSQPRVSQDVESVNAFTISTTPPRWIESDTPLPESTPIVKAENHEGDTLSAGNVFKATGLMREKADEIKETRQIREEKPIDLLPAEEIVEEVSEQVENVRTEFTDEGGHDETKEDKRIEGVEDDVEIIEDDSKQERITDMVNKVQVEAWQNGELGDESESNKANSNENSHQLLKEGSKTRSVSTETDGEKAADDVTQHEGDNKDGDAGRASSLPDKTVNATDDKNEASRPAGLETEKSDKESDKEEDEVKFTDENATDKNESENPATGGTLVDSNNNLEPVKGSSDSKKD